MIEEDVNSLSSYDDIVKELEKTKRLNSILIDDFRNFKTRMYMNMDEMTATSNRNLILDILTIVDDMERLVADINQDSLIDEVTSRDSGFEIIYENMIKLLESKGCKKIQVEEMDMFDVNFHDAINTKKRSEMSNIEKMDFPHNSIYKIYSSGWMMNGKLLKPAKVCVAD